MNVQRIKQQLDKVNSYYGFLIENQSNISRLDRDAFLATIRSLYDACLEEESTVAPPKATEPKPEPKPTTPPPVKKEEKKKRPKLVFTTPTKEEPKKEEAAQQDTKSNREPSIGTPPPKLDSVAPPTSIAEEPKATPPKKEQPTPKKEMPTPEPQETPQPEPVNADSYEEYEELFLFKEATDLSQKLSTSPIEDLQKALGMNEKYLYINELFAGDVADFQAALKTLNTADNFDQARHYLEQHCIGQYHWMEKNKKGTAKSFVKLVRRRHL